MGNVPFIPLFVAALPAFAGELPTLEVTTTPVPALTVPLDEVPQNVQGLDAGDISRRHAVDLASLLDAAAGSVNVNDSQGSRFQLDLNFRGFTASPVLGTPQGISVFQDGVRINESLGDTVNWDLIPPGAIARVAVMPGANPLFGLNALGGALVLETKSGFAYPGTAVEATGGASGYGSLAAESGGHAGPYDWFGALRLLRDDGWGDHNPARVHQLFLKTGRHDGDSDLTLSLSAADNRIEGNQTLPRSFADLRRAAYTWPDETDNRLLFLNLAASRYLSPTLLLAGTAYWRQLQTDSVNSNINDGFDPAAAPGPGNSPALNVSDDIREGRPGVALQLSVLTPLVGQANRLTLGASYDGGSTSLRQRRQEAAIAPDRGTHSVAPQTLITDLRCTNNYYGLWLSDTFSPLDSLHVTASGRYNGAEVRLHDELGTALNGHHSFRRFNPAAGVTWRPVRAATFFVSWGEGMRAPTPVELGCADPAAPCSLPNAFAADPALRQVVSRTVEFGARGEAGWLRWSGALFRTTLDDDLQFVSSGGGATSAGFFENVGRTRRQGFEAGVEAHGGPLTVSIHFSVIAATFETPFVLSSPANSTAAPLTCATCTEIAVQAGDRIPGIPRETAKFAIDYQPLETLRFGIGLTAQSGTFARGDENNRDANGAVPGYAVVQLAGDWDFRRHWTLFARVENLLDRGYSSFGLLGQNVFTGPGRSFDAGGASWRSEQFRSVGTPRQFEVGVRARW